MSRTFLGLSEQMLLVTILAKSFPFGSAEIQMHCTIPGLNLYLPYGFYNALFVFVVRTINSCP